MSMRLGILNSSDRGPQAALIDSDESYALVCDLIGASSETLIDLIQDSVAMSRLKHAENQSLLLREKSKPSTPLMRWAPPLLPVRNIICVGKNYDAHIKERTRAGDSLRPIEGVPIFFTKATTSVIGSGEYVIAWHTTSKLDYEAELAVIIGKRGRNISKERAFDYILGYALMNDVTGRDIQDAHKQWFLGKSLDTFCPLGPYLVTKDEIEWPVNINITLSVNGELRQNFWTQHMIFDIPTIISELSKNLTLLPGDVIATGTADGCASAFSPPRFLKPGDKVLIHSTELGNLENEVVSESTVLVDQS